MLTLFRLRPHHILRFSLKTRWTTKSDQKTVFTDSLYLYVCGLASSQCTHALVQLAKVAGRPGVQIWVQKRQELVLKLLKAICHSNTLTGPKVGRNKREQHVKMKPYFPFCLLLIFSVLPLDPGALPLRAGEPGPAPGRAVRECEIHPGAAQHLALTK